MQEQRDQRQDAGRMDEEAPTPQEVDEVLQQEMRRQAATREETPDPAQVSDSANQEGMGSRNSGEGRRTGRSG